MPVQMAGFPRPTRSALRPCRSMGSIYASTRPPGDGGRVWGLTTTRWLVGHVAGNGVTLTVDLSVIHDYLAASGVSSVTMVVDVDHEQHVVRGTISDDELTFHLPIYRGDQGRPVTLYDCDICPASYVRTVEYANPMRMVLTQ